MSKREDLRPCSEPPAYVGATEVPVRANEDNDEEED